MSAIAEFQTNPQAALAKYRDNEAVQSFLKEFCGLVGMRHSHNVTLFVQLAMSVCVCVRVRVRVRLLNHIYRLRQFFILLQTDKATTYAHG